jgi:hypothetical protein
MANGYYETGTITVALDGTDVTGVGTAFIGRVRVGDKLTRNGFTVPIIGPTTDGITLTSNTALTLAYGFPVALTGATYKIELLPDLTRSLGASEELIDLLGNGNLEAAAGLSGSANQVIMFTGPGAMTTVPKVDLISGAAFDVQVANLAARAAYDTRPAGYTVLVSNIGDGRSAIYSKNTGTSADWSAAAYVTGATGPIVTIASGTTTTLAAGSAATAALAPVTGGYELNLGIPAGRFDGLPYNFDTSTTDADPGAGDVRANNASLASATFLYVSKTTAAGSAMATFLLAMDDSTNTTIKGDLILKRISDGVTASFKTGAVTDATNYVKVAVSSHAGATSFANADALSFDFTRTGDKGADGAGTIVSVNAGTGIVVDVTAPTAPVISIDPDLLLTVSLLALQVADNTNVALFLGASGNRVADSFDALTYVDVAGATNLDTSAAGLLKPTTSLTTQTFGTTSASTVDYSSGGTGFTVADIFLALTAADVIYTIGAYQVTAATFQMKIVKRNSAGNFDVVVTQSFSHPGGGWADLTLSSPYTVPGSGSYYPALYTISATAQQRGASTSRAYKAGNITGTAQSGFTEDTSANVPAMRVGKNLVTNNLTVRSASFTAASAPTKMKALLRVKEVDAGVAGTDYSLECSRDGGTTWSTMTLTELFTSPSPTASIRVVDAAETSVSGQPSGTTPRWRFKTLNNKSIELHDALLYWS